jgi:replicative DNA helicase
MTQQPSPAGGGNGRGLERLPPQAIEVEQAVLGAMLLDNRAVGRAIELLDRVYFYHSPHGKIFDAIIALYERNEAVDQLTLGEELKKRGHLEEVGGVVYLATLASEVATAANIDHHAKIVLEKGLTRSLIEATSEIAERAYEERSDAQELLDWSEQRIFSLSEKQLSQGFEGIDDVLHETFEQIELAHNRDSSVTGVDTGFADLNDMTSGFQNGDLVIIAARPSVGKTALAMCLARNAAVSAGKGVAIFSLEMSKQQVAQRLLCIETRIDLHKLRTGRLRDDDWLHLTRNVTTLAQAPIYIDDAPGITVLEARAKTRRLMRERGIGLVIIDYLQLMTSRDSINSREQEVSSISRGLKGLAKELNVPVVALSQLSRATESRTDRRPQLSDLRESGSIEQDADVVMFIYRPDLYGLTTGDGASLESVAEIIIGKQRNGPTGSVNLMWNAPCASFETLAQDFRIEQEEDF